MNDRITCRVPKPDRRGLDELVERGRYAHVSDAVRTAIREFLDDEYDGDWPRGDGS